MDCPPELAANQPLLNGRYVVEAFIGRSAAGEIYLARSQLDHTPRAILVVSKASPDSDARTVSLLRVVFRRAAALAGRLTHPHIVHVVEYAEDKGHLYLVSEYAAGGSLRQRLQDGPLPWPEAVRIALEVAAGLAALYSQLRAVHRDVKPGNILFDENGRAKLAGLGLAQLPGESERVGRPYRHPGTAEYMSPEQAGTTDYLSPSSDVYSLGCILFEMLTGRPWKEARREVGGPRELRPNIPEWLDQAVRRMLRDEPGLDKADAANPRKRFIDMPSAAHALIPSTPTAAAPPLPLKAATPAAPPDRESILRAAARWLLLGGIAVLLPGLAMLGTWVLRKGVLGTVDGVPIVAEPSWLALVRVVVGLWGLVAALGLWNGQRWGRSLGLLFAVAVETVGLLATVLIVVQIYTRGTQHYFAAYLWTETFLGLVGFSGGILLAGRLGQEPLLRALGLTLRRPAGVLPIAVPLLLTLVGILPAIGLLHGKNWGRRVALLFLVLFTVLAGIAAVGMAAGMQMDVCGYVYGEYKCTGPVPNPWGSMLAITVGLVIVSWCIAAIFYLGSERVRSHFER